MTITASDQALLPTGGTDAASVAGHAARARRLGWPLLGLYGVGGSAEHVISFGLSNLLLFYLTIVCGLPGSVAGLAMGLALVADAVIQPLMGSLSDNSHSRFGRRYPFMVVGVIPLAVGFGLLYSIPAGLSGVALFGYAMVMLLATRVGHAVFNVPYVALGAELSDDYAERSLVPASRLLFGALGGALATWLAFGVFMKGHAGQTHREVYAPFAWSCAAIVAAGAVISILGTLSARNRLHAAAASQRFGLFRFFTELAQLFRNPSYRALFFTALALMVGWGAASALGLHANTYFWKLTTQQILSVNLLGVVGFLAGCVLAASLARRMQKKTMVFLGMGLIGICQLALAPAQLAGLIPAGGAVAAVTLSAVLSQAGMSITLTGFQSMMADAADHHEHLFGGRREGLCYSGTSLAAFAGSGLGSMIAGIGLDLIHFPHGVSKAVHLVVPAATLRDLGLLYGPGAGLVTVLAIVSLVGYRLSRDQHAAIRGDLIKRRDQAASAS